MNRFRAKKKAKDNADGIARPSTDSDGPSVPNVKQSITFRRGKKSQEEAPKPELDLASALPSTDDFRTSLLMSGLSARFSMLREQDDPKSKIGKASDDSVLFPKRQSRLNDFGFQGHSLSDIAEVSSINRSIRPPFAFSRADSYNTNEGYGTDDDSQYGGSIMNRAKPGESNNLFGGRQKIYMGNRTLYDNDVSQSAFQKLRERERQQKEEVERQDRDDTEAQSSRPSSPPLSGYNRNRETSSTTSSGGPSNTRISTAATSFTSQRTPSLSGAHTPISPNPAAGSNGLERSVTKTRRLYENGLDNHLHEQQFSAMSRIDTLTRQRTLGGHTPPPGLSPTLFGHPADRWGDRVQIASKGSMPNLRTASPLPNGSAMGAFDFGVRQNTIAEKPFGMTTPPLSPPMSENEEQGVLTVQPNDRGKATALGAFSKPAQPYDENKYSQRQLQMQEGRETPPLRKHPPPTAFLPKQQQMPGRTRAQSNATFASERSRSTSSAQRQFLPNERIPEAPKQLPVLQNKAIASDTLLGSDDSSTASAGEPEPTRNRAQPKPVDLSSLYDPGHQILLERPPESQHPAHRQRPFDGGPASQSPMLMTSEVRPSKPAMAQQPADSPTLGPATSLSGMVRQHMRTDSNTSSVYGGVPSVNFSSRFPLDPTDPMPQNDYGTKNNPWDTEDWDHDYYGESSSGQDAAANSLSGNSFAPPPLSVRSPNHDHTGKSPQEASWGRELETRHTRDGSTETQKEHQDFKNELASRRRQITENLKSFHETESRSTSPLPPAELPKDAMNAVLAKTNALGLLKTKTSRGPLVVRSKEPAPSNQPKAMKMLGIGNTTVTSSPSPRKATFDESWKQEEEEMLRGVPTTPPATKAFRQARRDAQRERERQVALKYQQRMARDAPESEWPNPRTDNQPRYQGQNYDRAPPNIRTGHRTPSRERKPPPVTYAQRNGTASSWESKDSTGTGRSESRSASRTSRDRSGSDTSGGRSKSRNGRYRDDLAKAMAEGTSSLARGAYDELEVPSSRLLSKSPGTPNMAYQQSPIPSPMIGPESRARSNSRSGYFDQKPLMVQVDSDMEIGKAPRPSPTAPFVVNPTPALVQASPAGSGTSTPVGGVSQGIAPRKRSINKSEISEPRFISSTSRVDTINLPPGSSLKNGLESHAPPIPPVNPRRRQTRAMFGLGRKDDYDEQYSIPAATQSSEEMSTFSADEDSKPKNRTGRLRKSSSERGNLNARAREIARAAPSPAMPGLPSGSPSQPIEGGMF